MPHFDQDRLTAFAGEFDRRLAMYLTPPDGVPEELVEAVRYSALAPGKRIRPYLAARSCELVGGDLEAAWPVAAAVECVHAFSLIHDDLPAMDDDDLRRGQPTCHKKFGEAVAILAGDALGMLAFEILSRHVPDGRVANLMCLQLATGTGWSGMIGGQVVDIAGEAAAPSVELATYIHERKTARLFETACRLGALAGQATNDTLARLARYGQRLGWAFQIADDLLDLTSTSDRLGKRVGKDSEARKQTYPRCVGMERSRAAAKDAADAAMAELGSFGPEADDLRGLAAYVVDRNY
ncbi:MAG: polyprenyl synthetase family protein [Phycisphaerae bacterium]|jgi:geranylgeranyl diphosphate synthase type II